MRQYYASDKKKREDAKRKQKEEKRLRKLNRASANSQEAGADPVTNAAPVEVETQPPDPKS